MMKIDDSTKRAVKQLVQSSTTPLTRIVTPEGHVVVVARVSAVAPPAEKIAELFGRHGDDGHDVAACLYGWYEEHTKG